MKNKSHIKASCLRWAKNIFGYHHVSLWACDIGDNDPNPCYEYGIGIGSTKIAALFDLVKNLYRTGDLYVLLYISHQVTETNGLEKYKKRHFRIVPSGDENIPFKVLEKKWFSWVECPDLIPDKDFPRFLYFDFIDKKARENKFNYIINRDIELL